MVEIQHSARHFADFGQGLNPAFTQAEMR